MIEKQKISSIQRLPTLKARDGLHVMYAAIKALFLRELQTRFGQYRLGYLWVFLGPLLNIGIVVFILGTVRHRMLAGMDYEIFLLNGIIPFFMFKAGVSSSLSAVSSNQGLFSYRPVKPIDALLARNFLELFLSLSAYVFFSAIALWFGFHISFEAIPQLLGYWLSLFVFMIANSLIFIVVGHFSKEINKFISISFLVLYFLSGILYSIHIVPLEYQYYLLFNPLIHIIELMRHAVSPSYPLVAGISLIYFWQWIIGTLFIGLLLYKRFERRMVKSK